MNFTMSDIEVIIQALECWEKQLHSDRFTGLLLSGMLSKTKEDFEKVLNDNERETKLKDKTAQRAEKVVRLKVKLLDLREELLANQINDAHAKH